MSIPDMIQVCSTFPTLPVPMVFREDLLSHIHDHFSHERNTIVISAPPGMGKTTLLAQFAITYKAQVAAYFADKGIPASHPKTFLQDMCAQLLTYLGRPGRKDKRQLSFSQLEETYNDLVQAVRKGKSPKPSPLFIVIDGLQWCSDIRVEGRTIVDLLPNTGRNIYLLVSSIPSPDSLGKPHFPYELKGFSHREALELFNGVDIAPSTVRNLRDKCNGMPIYLAVVRHLLDTGHPIDSIAQNLPQDVQELVGIEWGRFSKNASESALRAVALLTAVESFHMSIDDLAELSNSSPEELERELSRITFLTLRTENEHRYLEFVSDVHREYCAARLRTRIPWAKNTLLSYFESQPPESLSLDLLARVYADNDRHEQLKSLVQPNFLAQALRGGRDTSSLLYTLDVFVQSAAKHEAWVDQFSAALGGSIVRSLATEAVSRDEVEALLSLDRFDRAAELALRSTLSEDRLELCSMLAEYRIQKGETVEPWLRDEIEKTSSIIRPQYIPERAQRIAAKLFHVDPKLAIRLLEQAVGLEAGNERSFDIALATISIIVEKDTVDVEGLRSRITDKSLRDFSRAASPIVATYSAQRVLEAANGIDDISGKIFLMREWCNQHRDSAEALAVIQEALEAITAASDYKASLRVLRQLAEPLSASAHDAELSRVVAKFDYLKDDVGVAPLGEKYRLEMLLAEAESHYSHNAAVYRLMQLYYELDDIVELDTRCYCMVRILVSLARVDRADELGLRQAISERLPEEIRKLLANSAHQIHIMKRILRALALVDPVQALEYANQLNTQEARDNAHYDVLGVIADQPDALAHLTIITTHITRITSLELQDLVRVQIIDALTGRHLKSALEEEAATILLETASSIRGPENRVIAMAFLLRGVDAAVLPDLFERVVSLLNTSYSNIDPPWLRNSVGWQAVAVLATKHKGEAEDLFAMVEREKESSFFMQPLHAETYLNTLALGIRVTSRLFWHPGSDTYILQLIGAVRGLPGSPEKCELATRLALRCLHSDRVSYFEDIVKTDILPYIRSSNDWLSRISAITAAGPCIYMFDSALFYELLEDMDTRRHDIILFRVIIHLLTRLAPGEPFEMEHVVCSPKYGEVKEACQVADKLKADDSLMQAVRFITDCIVHEQPDRHHPSKTTLTYRLEEKQALVIADELEKIISKLPDKNNIRHSGYVLICQALIDKIRSIASNRTGRQPDLRKYIAQVEQGVPNEADRVLVYSWIGEQLFHLDQNVGTEMIRRAEGLLSEIHNFTDRASRLYTCIDAWRQVGDLESAKSLFQQLLPAIESCSSKEFKDQLTERAFAAAHSIDAEFAVGLTSSIGDPRLKEIAENRIRASALKTDPQRILDQDNGSMKEQVVRVRRKAASMMLESINSKRAVLQHPRIVGKWISSTVGGTLEESSEVLHLVLQHIIEQGKPPSDLTMYLESCLAFAEFTATAASLIGYSNITSWSPLSDGSTDDLILLQSGDRSGAAEVLKKWLAQHARNYVKIVDPYFGYDDLEILKVLGASTEVFVVTSWAPWRSIERGRLIGDIETIAENFRTTWRKKISDQTPPPTTIRIVGTQNGDPGPLHDRYYITEGAGIWIGASLNHIGARDTTIKVLTNQEAARIEKERVNTYLSPEIRTMDYEGQRLLVRELTLA